MNIFLKVIIVTVLGVAFMYCNWAVSAPLQTDNAVNEPVVNEEIVKEIKNKITQILPGYELISNADHVQDEKELRNFLSQEQIDKRKKRKYLGLIAGYFNNDTYIDYAVQVVNRSIYEDRQVDSSILRLYSVKLMVCFGGRENIFEFCEVLPTVGGSSSEMPYWTELELAQKTSKLNQCGEPHFSVLRYYPEAWQGARLKNGQDRVPARKLKMTHDAIFEFAIGSILNGYLYRTDDGLYLDCAYGD